MEKKQQKLLSSNVLEMKFMKKSKENREKQEEQEKYAQVFESEQVKEETGSRVSHQPDQAVLEELVFPRRSYGGKNPQVEKLMAEKDGAGDDVQAERSDENDVTDEQMARNYSSVVGTIGRKFRAKRQHSPDRNGAPRTPSRPPLLKRVREFLKPESD